MDKQEKPYLLAAGAALLLQIGLGGAFIRSASPTFDEPVHLSSGHAILTAADYRVNGMDHPALGEAWAAIPLAFSGARPVTGFSAWHPGAVYDPADRFLYHNVIDAGALMARARVFCLLSWSAALFALLWLWGSRLGGPAAGAGACLAAAASPLLLSNLCLVTTDAAPAVFFFAAFFALAVRERRSPRVWAAAGALAGLALASKYSMVVLPPLALTLLLLERPVKVRDWKGVGLAALAGGLALALVYRVVSLPIFWKGLAETAVRLGEGRASYLFGRRSVTGFWLYFPVALLVKTPVALLLLAGYGSLSPAVKRRERLWILGPSLGYFAFAVLSRTQIGARHLLPMLPFLCLLAGLGASRLWAQGAHGRQAAGLLLAWALVSAATCAPHPLAYFNELVGGPAGGFRVLADSNLDWGQDLQGLAEYLEARGNPPIYLSYFGTADPAYYGIRYVPMAMPPHVERPGTEPNLRGPSLLAISATNFLGVYYRDMDYWSWLRERAPVAVIGESIYVYDLAKDPDARLRVRLSLGLPAKG